MSILPSQTNQDPNSLSSSLIQNPNFNHGNFTITDEHQFSNAQSSSTMPNFVSGTIVGIASNSSGSSKKVTGNRISNGQKKSPYYITNDRVESYSVAQGEAGSPESGGEISSSPPNVRANGSARRRSQIPNGNHLLNFQYNPISRPQPRAPPPRKPHKIKPYNKDLFLQANYKFVVLNSGNYTLESMDPDKMLLWEDIICVRYSTPHSVQCPICLDDPLCPQITSCGHIFCFPCILQYLLMGEDNHKAECWRKCPLCFMMISSKDMYTIYIEKVGKHSVGDTLDFMLLTRKKDSFSLHEESKGEGVMTRDSFSKFTLTLDVDLAVREAISALDNWLVRADSGLVDDLEKLPYVCAAMEQLKERKNYWNARRSTTGVTPCKTADFKAEGHETFSSSIDQVKVMQIQADSSRDPKDRDAYNFYQTVDGQPIILHPLNMKCLLHHYGSYDQLPLRVCGKILQFESVTQTEAIRRRYRYLSHFPLTTTFQLCEIDLREILPSEALLPFMDEIKKREKQRKWLARKEREDRCKAEAVAAYSPAIPYNVVQYSVAGSSTFSMDDFEALGSSSTTTVVASSPPVPEGRQLFASVARLGFASSGNSPSLNKQETSVRPAMESSSNAGSTQGLRSFANVISREVPIEPANTRKMNEVGKKGKKQSRVLLSTSGARRY